MERHLRVNTETTKVNELINISNKEVIGEKGNKPDKNYRVSKIHKTFQKSSSLTISSKNPIIEEKFCLCPDNSDSTTRRCKIMQLHTVTLTISLDWFSGTTSWVWTSNGISSP